MKEMIGVLLEQNSSNFAFGEGGYSWDQIHAKSVIFKHDSSADTIVSIVVNFFDSLGQFRLLAFFGVQSLFGENDQRIGRLLMTLFNPVQIKRSACPPVILRNFVYQQNLLSG